MSEVSMNTPNKLIIRLLIAAIIITVCVAFYPLFYCQFTVIC